MNTVPFDQLGPGQSGRLAYQVLGQDGPIYNPKNIRYLPPDSPEIADPFTGAGASGLSVGLGGFNLISSFLNLAVSVHISRQLDHITNQLEHISRQLDHISDQLEHIQEMVNRIERKIDYIVEKVDRIDTQVAENNLRHALEYVLQKAVSKEGIDLSVLTDLTGDLEKFADSLSSPDLMLNFSLQLSSDIRDRLRQICNLAYGVRKLVTRRHNAFVDGDPVRIITVNPIDDYFRNFGGLRSNVRATFVVQVVSDSEYKDLFEEVGWLDLDGYSPLFDGLSSEDGEYEDYKSIEQAWYDVVVWCLYRTDAGLLYRTQKELGAIGDGYENTFWPELAKAEPCGFDHIDIVCDLPLLDNS